ncbi:hypothetical protein AM493_17195 [Flavobacterium akiainvivens]|uniref:PAS domain-containing protein n=1 Tax=Flavobacterium akiainvivens TaxID=1202724 RepID=A0A0M8ML26_9FLAO|nr:hypothetical protein AM493_17195 [Flavobacterium akiainvivens]
MKSLDLYLSSLSKDERDAIADKLQPSPTRPPLASWDIYSQAYQRKLDELERAKDLTLLNQLKAKYAWVYDFDALDWDNATYEAIVVTDANAIILHATPGFVAMTGYAVKKALGKSPNFLQGPNTLPEPKQKIRQAIDKGEPVVAQLVNYRKNGEQYMCEVNIIPLYNSQDKLTHFIAFEREVA